jgi:outer membrane protein insertion porin family
MTTSYELQQYFRLPFVPLLDRVPFGFNARASYATAFGDTDAIPPYRHFFTGGSNSVRGFRDGTLGPRDSLGNPYGGDAALSGQFEAILPFTGKLGSSTRVSLFFDFGQSFYLGDTEFTNKRGSPVDTGFDLSELRTAAGVGVEWLAPLGLFRFSYAYPLRYQRDTWKHYGDDIERFQFSIGSAF